MPNTYYKEIGGGSGGGGLVTYATLADLPTTATVGDVASVQDADGLGHPGVFQYGSDMAWHSVANGQIPAVDSVNGKTGVVTLTSDDVPEGAINKYLTTKNSNTFAGFDNSGILESVPGFSIDTTSGGLNEQLTIEPNDENQGFNVNNFVTTLNPIIDSPNVQWNSDVISVNIDTNNDGFSLGTNGTALILRNDYVSHQGKSDLGFIEFNTKSFDIGNGTDPLDVRGVAYSFGFGQVHANVNVTNSIQGYGFQPNVDANATISSGANIKGFFDQSNINCSSPGYTSFIASPNIAEITNNHNYQGVNISPNIPNFEGNANFTGLGIYGNYGTLNGGGWQGINVSPSITSGRNVNGINISLDNVSLYAGVVSSLIIQDLTISTNQPTQQGNSYTVEFEAGGTAGSEVVSLTGQSFKVQIQSGVSTATQVNTALNGYIQFSQNFNSVVSGIGSNPQVTQAPTSLTGGEDPGTKKAAYLDGDVEITGSLQFGGALSIGQLNSFSSVAIVDGGGNPTSINSLICQATVPDNTTIANADTLGLNTAMLLAIGSNSTVTTSFVGVAALALPAVVSMGTGSTIDQVSGATFALSLDGSATGGTIQNLDLCRSLAIPNGVTSVTNLRGYKFDLPFGDPGTNSWGFYAQPEAHNYFAGDLKLCGTDIVSNSSVALEIESTTKALLNARMTTTQRNALTAINGMQLYNTTTDKLQVYAGGSWVDLH